MTNGESGMSGPSARPRQRRWLIAALVVSLAFNLFIVGWAGVRWAMWSGGWHYMLSTDHRDDGTETESSGREIVRDLLAEHGTAALALAGGGSLHLRDAADALDRESLDQAGFETAVRALEKSGQELLSLVGIAAREGASRMTMQQRERMASRLRKAADRLERRQGRWGDRLARLSE